MSDHAPTPRHELEEAAEGTELFRTPGGDLQVEEAREQAEAAGWLPPDVIYDSPALDIRQRILHRRQDLHDAMWQLESSVARATRGNDWADGVRDALTTLESALQRHMAEIESPGGLFTQVIDRAPHLEHDVERLRGEHRDLLAACRNALDMVTVRALDASELRRRVLGILGRLAIHRQRGSELLFDTYNVDLGAAG